MKTNLCLFSICCAGVIFLTGCIPLPLHSYDGNYPGLQARLKEATTNHAVMHIVTVHGIGYHEPGYSTNFADAVAGQLRLDKEPSAGPKPLVSSAGVTNWLWEFGYSRGDQRVLFHEVTWSPTTSWIKTNAFTTDVALKHRVLVNKSLKIDLVDGALADAVLYLNPQFRDAMQEPILQTITNVVRQTGSNDPIILVTHSLGSKMTFDSAIRYEEQADGQLEEHLSDIIMLANQLPLLHLGTATNVVAEVSGSTQTALKKLLSRSLQRKHGRARRPVPAPEPEAVMHVIAATDPNDILSYPLADSDVVPGIALSNIYSHNAWIIPFILEWPEWAHDNYYYNKWLIKKLVNGYGKNK